MASTDRIDTIRAIFAAYLSSNRKLVEDALSEDFRFTSPYDDSIDKPTYFERCWKSSDWIEREPRSMSRDSRTRSDAGSRRAGFRRGRR